MRAQSNYEQNMELRKEGTSVYKEQKKNLNSYSPIQRKVQQVILNNIKSTLDDIERKVKKIRVELNLLSMAHNYFMRLTEDLKITEEEVV